MIEAYLRWTKFRRTLMTRVCRTYGLRAGVDVLFRGE